MNQLLAAGLDLIDAFEERFLIFLPAESNRKSFLNYYAHAILARALNP
jgi:hypothetical protein